LITERWEAVEGDIRRYYGEQAAALGCRELWVLIQGLPAGTRSRSGTAEEWLTEHELAATLIEVIVNQGRKKADRVKIPRPKQSDRRPVSKEEAVERVHARMAALARLPGGA